MKRWKLTKGKKTMFWTLYSQNGLVWLESDRGDTLKVSNIETAEEIIENQKGLGWSVSLSV